MRELSDEENERVARSAREALGFDEQLQPDLIDALDTARRIGLIVDHVTVADEIMGTVQGHFDPRTGILYLSESTRSGAEAKVPRHCFTVAHELAHRLLKHEHPRNRNAVRTAAERLSPRIRAEDRAAERLAAAILAPYHRSHFTLETTAQQIADRFNLSLKAASIRREEFARMFRRKHKIERAVPSVVVDFREELARRGRAMPRAPQLVSPAVAIAGAKPSHGASARPSNYDPHPCPQCGRRTLTLIDIKYVCMSGDCDFVGDLPDGD